MTGSCIFVNGSNTISADQGSFNWKTKLASFEGNVKVNGTPKEGKVTYDVLKQSFVEESTADKNTVKKAKAA